MGYVVNHGMQCLHYGPFLTKKKITIRDLFVVKRDFFRHNSHDFFLAFP